MENDEREKEDPYSLNWSCAGTKLLWQDDHSYVVKLNTLTLTATGRLE